MKQTVDVVLRKEEVGSWSRTGFAFRGYLTDGTPLHIGGETEGDAKRRIRDHYAPGRTVRFVSPTEPNKRMTKSKSTRIRSEHLGREFTRYLLEYYGPRGRSTDVFGRPFAASPMTTAEAEWATRELMTRKLSGFLGDSGDREEARDLVLEHRRSGGHAPNRITTATYSMPAHWASYLINGDASGLDDDDIAQADAAIKDIGLGSPVDVSESDFRRGGDYGSLAGDYADYTFHVIEDERPGYAPNEDLAWREVYASAYKAAAAEGLEDWRAREEASRAAWADYEARTGQVPNDSLHRRIAATLGWTESSTRSMSLASLRDLVRPVDPALAEEIGERIRSGRHIAQPGGAQRSQAELWRQMFGREPPRQRPNANGFEYYVWAIARGSNKPLAEGPWGPYETLDSAKTFARIGATEGAHDRAVSLGFDPESSGFRIVRRYESGTGDRLL